jgi:hypothetical protein
MGDVVELRKARLVALNATFTDVAADPHELVVQFNPETLKVTYQNKPAERRSAGDQRGNSTRQVVGSGESKLSFQLWFDVNAQGGADADDVRVLTSKVAWFMTPSAAGPAGRAAGGKPAAAVPPGVRFEWGTFRFDGFMDSLEETLDLFSPDGRPLRASVSVSLSGQLEIVPLAGGDAGGAGARDGTVDASTLAPTPGMRPLSTAPAGASLPGVAAALGLGGDWQRIAAANGIENPRLLPAGQLVDLQARTREVWP